MVSDEKQNLIGFLESHYNIRGDISELVAYQDKNYLVKELSGKKYILKITTDPDGLDFIISQNRVLRSLSNKPVGKLIPCPLPSLGGDFVTPFLVAGKPVFIRLFSFLEGDFLAEIKPDISFFKGLGRAFAEIDKEMNSLEDAVLLSRTHEWDLARVLEIAEDVNLVADPADRRLAQYFLMKYREEVVQVLHKLPKTLIHSDGNNWNILVSKEPSAASEGPRLRGDDRAEPSAASEGPRLRGDDRAEPSATSEGPRLRGDDKEGRCYSSGGKALCEDVCVSGVIDFGDMVWGPRVNEVAIVLAYAMMGREDFKEVYKEVIDGYSNVILLSDNELSIIYYLVSARWCQTLVMAARQERANPGSIYHQVSVSGARKMLHEWIRVNPAGILNTVKNVKIVEEVTGVRSVGWSPEEEAEQRYRYFSRAVSLSYKEPIHMVGAAMQYMYGADGRTYLDCVNNIPHVGHCHPKVVEAGQRQMARLNTNTRYLYDSLDRYASRLLSKFPPSLCKVFFVNSGSAATDLAVRLAEAHTGICDYLVLDYAYHGNTKAAIGLSPYKFSRKGGKGKPGNVTILDLSPSQEPPPAPLLRSKGEKSPRTFFAESIVGCAGQIVLSKELMQQTVIEVRDSGGIYVADEVQTGFGRTGHKFWAYELYEVVPDMVILGKPMGNGHPMGAVVCTEAIARSFETGMEFFSSFGGNPVSCEIGIAVLEVIEEERLQENAREVGYFLIRELKEMTGRQDAGGRRQEAAESRDGYLCLSHHASRATFHVSDVRGSGLFLGIELIESGTGNPATEAAGSIVNGMKDRGFLLSTDGPFNNVIKFKPPMCFSRENAEDLVRALKEEFFASNNKSEKTNHKPQTTNNK